MAEREYTNYQKKVIQRYYDNRDTLDVQKLSELCSDLYLTEGKKKLKLWESARELLVRLEIPQSRIEHVLGKADPALLAEIVKELHGSQ